MKTKWISVFVAVVYLTLVACQSKSSETVPVDQQSASKDEINRTIQNPNNKNQQNTNRSEEVIDFLRNVNGSPFISI